MSEKAPHCALCVHLDAELCAIFGKKPPAPDFAARCRHYDRRPGAELPVPEAAPDPVAGRPCATWHKNCPSRDEDEHGAWCRIDDPDGSTFRPIREGMACPALTVFVARFFLKTIP